MYSFTIGFFYPKFKNVINCLLLSSLYCFSTITFAVQPFHQVAGPFTGYENEIGANYSGLDWSKLPSYSINQVTPARINSYVSREIDIVNKGNTPGDDIFIRFYNPENIMVDESEVSWSGSCWTVVMQPSCMTSGWSIENAHYVANEIGIWTVETVEVTGGFETLLSKETFEVKGREMEITNGGNLTVYENDNSRTPLEIKLIDYDNVSGTPSKEISYEVIQRPKGKASGGLNYVYESEPNYTKRGTLNAYTNHEGLAKLYWESGNKPGVYIIQATSYWAPESPVEFTVTVKEGRDPDKEDDFTTEVLDVGRNQGKPRQCEALVGNPINIITGNKYEEAVDLANDSEFGIEFVRYYNSTSNVELDMGPKWSYSYSRFVSTRSGIVNGSSVTIADLHRDNGEIVKFYKNKKTWLPVYQDTKTKLILSGKTWHYTNDKGEVEEYNSNGKLQKITLIDGNAYTVSYREDETISEVISPTGYTLSFIYKDGKIDRVGRRYYDYHSSSNGMLTSADELEGRDFYYHYEDEIDGTLLTGFSNKDKERIAIWEYNDKGQAISSSLGDGSNKYTVEYRNDGSRTVTNPNGTTSEYLAVGQLGLGLIANADGPACATGEDTNRNFSFNPDTNNLMSKTINGVTTRYGNYNEHGQPGYIIEAYGTAKERRTNYTYDQQFTNKISTIEQPSVSGQTKVTQFSYDDFAHLTSVTEQGYEPDGTAISRTTNFEYNGVLGQVSMIDGPRDDINDSYSFVYHELSNYSSSGKLKTIIGPDGKVIKDNIYYLQNGFANQYLLSNGTQILKYSDITLNFYRIVRQSSDGTAVEQSYTYDFNNNISSITLAAETDDESIIYFEYDQSNRLTKVNNSLGQYIEFTRDHSDNIISQSVFDANGELQRQIVQLFDDHNNPASVISENTRLDSIYNQHGLITQQTNANQVQKNYTYDTLKRLVSVMQDVQGSDPQTANTQYQISYDVHNNPVSITDANDNVTTYSYDDFGNKLYESSPDRGNWSHKYDKAGNKVQTIDAKGQVFTYQFDGYNRAVQVINNSENSAYNITNNYQNCNSGEGKICAIEKDNTTLNFQYNGFEQVSNQKQTISLEEGTIESDILYNYDLAGRVKQIIYPSGVELNYLYDSAGNIASINANINGVSQNLINSAQHTFSGNLTSLKFGNGLTLNKSYDLAGRITAVENGPIKQNYTLDGVGNMLTKQQIEQQITYSFDALNRLLTSNNLSNAELHNYLYDKNGNRTSLTTNTDNTNYQISPTGNAILAINSTPINIDANGNTLTRNGQTLQYSPYNQLEGIANVASYQYNGLGQRVSKTDLTTNVSQYFVYNTAGQLISELDNTGNPVTEHIYLNNMPIAVIKHEINTSQVYYVHTDHLNTPRTISNQSQQTLWQWQSDAFGNGEANEDVNLDGKQFIYNKRFPGQYYDQESGLHYNYYRDYDPQTGRYIQSDPIGLNGGLNTFAYVGGNPIIFIDPLGLRKCSIQEAKDLGLSNGNCWIGTDDIEGKCITAECAAGVLPNPNRTDKQACYAICLGMGQVEGKSLDKFLKAKADNYSEKACEGVNANIKINKVLDKAGVAGKFLGLATTGQCLKICSDSFN
ncbi:RHS repeat domain-containing protein [Thalassomonas sp. M1454]|uniref:RHS repeat domain-containing protein n=1 Tax=Thalassomonas sp. M1454 TaxID=2594477 RepID=UPI001180AA30|nr:RHS repeat-associated core domain-containing protein [Thalassomonas sp. M1454]TRX57221.1 RHS repeat protein [Thalassomonas sp. M1454]